MVADRLKKALEFHKRVCCVLPRDREIGGALREFLIKDLFPLVLADHRQAFREGTEPCFELLFIKPVTEDSSAKANFFGPPSGGASDNDLDDLLTEDNYKDACRNLVKKDLAAMLRAGA